MGPLKRALQWSVLGLGVLAGLVGAAIGLLPEPTPRTPLHTCVATLEVDGGALEVAGWGSTAADARRAAETDGRILAETLHLVDVYGPTLSGDSPAERAAPSVKVGSCSSKEVAGTRFSASRPKQEAVVRSTPAAALSAARRRACGPTLQATLSGGRASMASFRQAALTCWTGPPPELSAVEGPAAPVGVVLCDLPHDELRSAAFGVAHTTDDALESALRHRALAHVLRGHANAAGAMSADAPARPALSATGFVLAAGFVVPHAEIERAAAHCSALSAEVEQVGLLTIHDRAFLDGCTQAPGGMPTVSDLQALPTAVDQMCLDARAAHFDRLSSEGVDHHAAWSQSAQCESWCRARVQFPEAPLQTVDHLE